MACKITINGEEKTKAQINAIIAQMANNRDFVNSVIYDNYNRMTSDGTTISMDALNHIKDQFNLADVNEVNTRIEEELARRDINKLHTNVDKDRATLLITSAKDTAIKTGRFIKGLFSNSGMLGRFGPIGKEMYSNQVKKEAKVTAWVNRAGRNIDAFNNTMAKVDKFLTAEDKIALNNVLRGASFDTVPFARLVNDPHKRQAVIDTLEPAIKTLREHIDKGSALLTSIPGLLNPIQIKVIQDNMGTYGTVLYEAHRNENWAKAFEKDSKGNFKGGDAHKAIFENAVPAVKSYFQWEMAAAIKNIRSAEKTKAKLEAKVAAANAPMLAEEGFIKDMEKKIAKNEAKLETLKLAIASPEVLHMEVLNLLRSMHKTTDVTNVMSAGGKRGGIGKSIFKKKNVNIPQEIKELFGELKNPQEVYAATISKIASAAAAGVFQNQLLDGNERMMQEYNAGIAAGKNPNKLVPPMFSTVMLPGAGLTNKITLGDAFSILSDGLGTNSIYVNEDMKDFFITPEAMGIPSMLVSVLHTLNTVAKINATILSTPTQERNILSNMLKLGTVVAFDKKGTKALTQFIKMTRDRLGHELGNLKGLPSGQKHIYSPEFLAMEEVEIEQGLKGSELTVADINESLKNRLEVLNLIEAVMGKTIATDLTYKGAKGVADLLFRTYAAGDDVVKSALFFVELNKYSDAYYGMDYNTLLKQGTPSQIQNIQNIAGEKTRATVFNYGEAWALTKAIQRYGAGTIVGPFIVFKLEQIRTTIDTTKTIREELNYTDTANPDVQKKIRSIGHRRRLSFFALLGLSSYTSTLLIMKLLGKGVRDDDEKYVRKYWVPEFVDSPIITKSKTGGFEMVDNGSINLYGSVGSIDAAIHDLLSGDPYLRDRAIWQMVKKNLDPLSSPQIGAGTILRTSMGVDEYGREFFSDAETTQEQLLRGAGKILHEIVVPGTVKALERKDDKIKKLENRIRALDSLREMYRKMDPDAKGLALMKNRIKVAEQEIELFTEHVEREKFAFFPGIRQYRFDPERQFPPAIYEKAKSIKAYTQEYRKRIEADRHTTEKRKDEIFEELEKRFHEDIKFVKGYYKETSKLGYKIDQLIINGTLKGHEATWHKRNNIFENDVIDYILGKERKIPPMSE